MDIFARIISIILPVFSVIFIGYGYAHWRGETVRADMAAVNRVCMEVLAPLLVFSALASKDLDLAHNRWLILASVLISLGSAVLAFGPESLSAAMALFTAATFVYFSFGVRLLQHGHQQHRGATLFALFKSPIMVAMILGVLFALLHLPLPQPLYAGMKLLGDASIPVMLFVPGIRLIDIRFKSWGIGPVGAIACPVVGLIMACLLDQFLPLTVAQRGQMYLFSALPPAVLCFMVAEQYRQEPDKVASIVLMGNLAALFFVPLGLWLGLPAAMH